jgi:hypothetical protein
MKHIFSERAIHDVMIPIFLIFMEFWDSLEQHKPKGLFSSLDEMSMIFKGFRVAGNPQGKHCGDRLRKGVQK